MASTPGVMMVHELPARGTVGQVVFNVMDHKVYLWDVVTYNWKAAIGGSDCPPEVYAAMELADREGYFHGSYMNATKTTDAIKQLNYQRARDGLVHERAVVVPSLRQRIHAATAAPKSEEADPEFGTWS
jgi:hypothetical protein